jgi:DNA adenine methylase
MSALTGWFGGKNSMSNWIYSFIPKDIKNYIEVFSGSMAIYFNEDFSHCENIVFNDFNKLQANFIACCKDHNKMLYELEKSLKPGGQFHYNGDVSNMRNHYRDLYTDIKNPEKCDFYDNMDFQIPNYEKAVTYSFMITSSFNACHARGAGFSGITKSNKLKLTTLINKLKKESYQYKLENLNQIEYLDFEDIIKKWDSDDSYLYLDPPYKYTDGNGTHDKDYGSENIFGDSAHKRLTDLLKSTKSRWSLSYYWFKELEEWFPRDKYFWFEKEFHRPSASFSNKEKGVELLICNYNPETGEKVKVSNGFSSEVR